MVTKNIKLKNVEVIFPKITIGRKNQDDKHEKRSAESLLKAIEDGLRDKVQADIGKAGIQTKD